MRERRARSSRWVAVPAALALLGTIGACGAGPSAPARETAGSPAAPASTRTSATGATTGSAELITVPDVSGMNHQQAQDTMQAAGLYNLREVDGKGLGRMLVVDSNWVQVDQDPPAGTKVGAGTVITLTAIKYTDR